MTATAVAVSADHVSPPPRQGIAALRARHAHSALLRCAWLRAALDPDVRSASIAMIVPVARNGDKANNSLYRTFEVGEIAGPTPTRFRHRAESAVDPLASLFSQAHALSRTAPWPPAWRLEDP